MSDTVEGRGGRSATEAVTAVVLLVVGLVYGYRAVQEGIGTAANSGSGFFPLLVSVALTLTSALVLVEVRGVAVAGRAEVGAADTEPRGDDGSAEEEPFEDSASWLRIVGVLLAALAVPLLADTTGFVVTLSAAVIVIAKIMGMPGWLKPLLLGVVFGIAVWLIFVYWLFVPLPAGSLGLA